MIARGRVPGVWFVPLALFVLLAAANAGGYRYGASDQAFYVPAVLKKIDRTLFPRDAELIDAQAELTLVDDGIALAATASHLELEALFAVLYVASLAVLAAAALALGGRLYRFAWTSVALVGALTLRHAIARSGTNTLEGYFHPRQLAFALGVVAIAAVLRGRWMPAVLVLLAAGALHPTTALWFGVWVAAAAFVAEPAWRRPFAVGAAGAGLAAAWALWRGPLWEHGRIMDAAWLATLADKTYLFPFDWPLYAWLANLAYLPLIVWVYRRRAAAGVLAPRETAVVAGVLSLVAVFALLLPLNAARIAIAVQLQPARIFWMLDFTATIYLVWALAEGWRPTARRAMAVAGLVLAASAGRGAYLMTVEFPEREVAQIDIPDSPWEDAMEFAQNTPPDTGWLADPLHAARYGSSLRVAGERDVLVEQIKDSAVGMYDRETALEVAEKLDAIGDFASLTPERAYALARRYDLDYLVTEQRLGLPLAYASGNLKVYRLK